VSKAGKVCAVAVLAALIRQTFVKCAYGSRWVSIKNPNYWNKGKYDSFMPHSALR
jgi:hypothetical protein